MKRLFLFFLLCFSLQAQVVTIPGSRGGGGSGSTITNLNANQFGLDAAGAAVIKSGATLTNTVLTTPNIGVASGTAAVLGTGSAGAPTFSFSGDSDTGFFSSSANLLGISVGGVERWDFSQTAFVPFIDNAYDIGNGTVNPRDLSISRNGSISGNLSVRSNLTVSVGVFTNSLTLSGNSVLTTGNISDVAEASSWNGVTTVSPSKNSVYDYFHTFDTDDDGLPDKLDLQTAGFVRTTVAGVISSGELSGDVTTSGSGVTTLANTAVSANTYGDATHVGQFTVDAKGRITAASAVAITGLGGSSGNWMATGTTNSSLAGTSFQDTGVFTNGITIGAGTSAGAVQLGDADNSNNITFAATNVMATNIYMIWPVAPYPGLLYATVAQGTNQIVNFTNTLAGLNGVLNSSIIDSSSISDTAEASSWNGVTTVAPSKNAVYDYVHLFDTDDDGLPDKLDLSSAGFVRTTSGGVINSSELSGDATTIGSGVLTIANSAITTAKIAANAVDGTKIALGSDAQGDVMYYNGTDYVRLPAGTSGQVLQTQGAGANPMWGNSGSITETGGPLFVSTADATVANTTTETSIIGSTGIGSKTLAANYLTTGKNIHVVVRGRIGTKTVGPGALTVKFKLGSTVIATNIFAPTASLANDYVEFVGDVTCRTIGATGTVFAQSSFDYNDGVTTPVNRPVNANTGTTTIDTTASIVVEVTATWATADANNTITGSLARIEDGSGGTLTATAGSLTANALVLGAGGVDTKVSPALTSDGAGQVILGVAGTTVGSIAVKNATSGTVTVSPPTGALGTIAVTWPNASSTLPIFGQQATFTGLTAARSIALPDANFTVARTDAANTFTGHQTIEGVTSTGATGTGKIVFDGSPTLVTPVLGVASATTINKVTLTTPATGSTLTVVDGKTFTVNNSITLSGTDSTTMTLPTTTATIARTDAAQTFTGVQTLSSSPVLSSGALTVGGNTVTVPSAADTLVGKATTDTLTGKTYDASGTGNVLKQTMYINLQRPDYGDGAGAVPQTNTFTASGLMHYTLSGNAETNANWIVYEFDCPPDLDTSVEMTARFAFLSGGTDTDDYVFHLTYGQVAAGTAYPTGTGISSLPIVMTVTPVTAANGDLQYSAATTLAGWAAALTPGRHMLVRVARLQNVQDDGARDVQLVLAYGSTK